LWPWANEQQWMIALVFVTAIGSLMVSYAKARAEGLGLECRTGLLARPERVVILAVGLLTGTTIWALTLLAVLSHVTTVERIIHVWRAATQPAHGAKQFAATASAQGSDGSGSDRHAQIDADKQRDSSASSVPTGLPPLTGSVHHD
jgi:CDP-diacylglycerol--glycerol-3-phosphate 3-phosphatidyltransferase